MTRAVFEDERSFPGLKGSLVFEIAAWPSLKSPNTAAVAVNTVAVQGPYVEQTLGFGAQAFLIETESGFDQAAQAVMTKWKTLGDAIEQSRRKTPH